MKQQANTSGIDSGASPDIHRALDLLWAEIRRHADAYTALKTAHAEIEQQMISTHKVQSMKEKDQEKLLQEQKVLNDRVKALERSLQQSAGLQQSYDALQIEMQALKRQSAQFDEELSVRQGQIEILEGKLANHASMDGAMRTALASLIKETLDIIEFPQSEEELHEVSQAIMKHVRGLRIDAEDRLEELQALRSGAKSQRKATVSDSGSEALLKEIDDLKSENKELLRALRENEKGLSTSKPSELEAEIKDLHLQLELKHSDIEMLGNRLKQAEDQLDDEREKNRELKDQIIALRDLHPEASGRKSSLESSVEKLRQERSELQSKIEELLSIQNEKDDMIDALRSAKGDLFDEAGFTSLRKENATLKAERLELTQKFEELQQRLEKALNA